MKEWTVSHVMSLHGSMGSPGLQTGRAGFVIHAEKGLTWCLNGCLDQQFITASVAIT